MPRFTFKKSERLCSLKAIEDLYHKGHSFYTPLIKCVYLLYPADQPSPCQVVFSVPKRNLKRAVDRNLLKRRMREAYRLAKADLYEQLDRTNRHMHLLLIYNLREVKSFAEINEQLLKALKTLARKIRD